MSKKHDDTKVKSVVSAFQKPEKVNIRDSRCSFEKKQASGKF